MRWGKTYGLKSLKNSGRGQVSDKARPRGAFLLLHPVPQCVAIVLEQAQPLGWQDGHEQLQQLLLFLNIKKTPQL